MSHVNLAKLYAEGLAMYRSGGMPCGDSTGWGPVDEHYTVALGQWTVVGGFPGSGKSEWVDALMVNLAERDPRWLFALYSPENFPHAAHLAKLVEKRARKPFSEGITPRMTEQEYADSAAWVLEHFLWLDSELRDPVSLLEAAVAYRADRRKLGVLLDPWNVLEHQRGQMSETDYISLTLTHVVQLCRAAQCHVWMVVHPAKIPRNRDGTRPVPTPHDLSGSHAWYSKADNIVTIQRDQVEGSALVEVHVQKVRHKWVGGVGLATLHYDRVTGRYFDAPTMIDPVTKRPERYADPEAVAEREAIQAEGA